MDLTDNPLRRFPVALLGCQALKRLHLDPAVLPAALEAELESLPEEEERARRILAHDWQAPCLTDHELALLPAPPPPSATLDPPGGALVEGIHKAASGEVPLRTLAAVLGDVSLVGTALEGVALGEASVYLRRGMEHHLAGEGGIGAVAEEHRETLHTAQATT